jgi:hypothetical protein
MRGGEPSAVSLSTRQTRPERIGLRSPENCAPSGQRSRGRSAGLPAGTPARVRPVANGRVGGGSGPGHQGCGGKAASVRPPSMRPASAGRLCLKPLGIETCSWPSAPLHACLSRLACPHHGEPLVQGQSRLRSAPFHSPPRARMLHDRYALPAQAAPFGAAAIPDRARARRGQLDELLTIAARVPDHGKLAALALHRLRRRGARKGGRDRGAGFKANNPEADDDKVAFERNRLLLRAGHHRRRLHRRATCEDPGMGAGIRPARSA